MVCNCCGGPGHPSTGHYVSEKMFWCGPCTRNFLKWYLSHSQRKYGKKKARVGFYDHAFPPKE